jgi:hypothetical protein
MVHPCKSGNPGTTMHACGNMNSAQTLCGLPVQPGQQGALVGYTEVCSHCFPLDVTDESRNVQQIEGRPTD